MMEIETEWSPDFPYLLNLKRYDLPSKQFE